MARVCICVCVCSHVHVCMQSASSYSSSDGHHKAASDHAELDQDLADIRNGTLHHAAAEKPCVADVVSTDQAAENSSSEENKMTYVLCVCVCGVCVCVCVCEQICILKGHQPAMTCTCIYAAIHVVFLLTTLSCFPLWPHLWQVTSCSHCSSLFVFVCLFVFELLFTVRLWVLHVHVIVGTSQGAVYFI